MIVKKVDTDWYILVSFSAYVEGDSLYMFDHLIEEGFTEDAVRHILDTAEDLTVKDVDARKEHLQNSSNRLNCPCDSKL